MHWLETIRPGDLLDILVVGALIFLLLSSLGRARARAFLSVMGGLGALYLLARLFGLHLSSMLLSAGLWIFSLVVVIAFQDDLRRSIHRLTAWRIFGGRGRATENLARSDLVASISRMAEKKVGALIVVPGQETLDPHVTGGLALSGKLSGPLLESIFSPDSPGHDGAVIVENGTVPRFGVHLPLSKRIEAIKGLGTRHSAALGLSERCDALIIVVSEERGEISVAKEGALHQGLTPEELARRLALHGGVDEKRKRRSAKTWISLALVSFASASLLWLAMIFREGTVQQTMEVPVEYRNVPAELALIDPKPNRVKVTIAGRRAAFGELSEKEVIASIDLSELQPGFHRLAIERNDVTVPATLDVLEIQPSAVHVRLRERADR